MTTRYLKSIIALLIILLLGGCASSKKANSSSNPNKQDSQIVSLNYALTANNLSEDASIMSTKNDEIILLIYGTSDYQKPALLFSEYFTFDKVPQKASFTIEPTTLESITIVLVEMDTELDLETIESKIHLELREIEKAYESYDARKLNKYFGDDDLFYIDTFLIANFLKLKKPLVISGIDLFDAYEYVLTHE